MKKLLSIIFVFFISISVYASDIKNLPYKNIKDNEKIAITKSENWTENVKRKDVKCFIRQGALLKAQNNSYLINTRCSYLFIVNKKLFGYSPSNLKFYEFIANQGRIVKKELNLFKVASLFKGFHVIAISEFSESTNVLKIKKKNNEEKIMIINDTDLNFDNYSFSTNNSKFVMYNINNAICITRRGMIQFSKSDGNAKNSPWFILLVR